MSTSDRSVEEWLGLLADPILAGSALDRLANASYQIVIEGESYRQRLSPHRALLEQKEVLDPPISDRCPTIPRPLARSNGSSDGRSKYPGYRQTDARRAGQSLNCIMARNPSLNESRGAMISNADQTALASDVQDSMDIIKNGVIDFVYRNRPASYRVIATELRKLLCDKDAVRSFDRKSKRSSLFELRYGRGDKIHLQAFAKLEPQIVASDWRDAGPAVYLDSVDILRAASGGDHLLSLWHWLKEESVLDARGSPVQTHRVLKDVADKEGAHIINWKADWRDKAGVALVTRDPSKMTTEELASADYEIGWKQFIVGAGARLLFARRRNRSGSELIFNTADMIPPPTTSRTSKMTLQMRT